MKAKREIIVDGDIARIPLTQGKVAIIDAEDIDLVSKPSWFFNSNGYAVAKINGKMVSMHRWLLGLTNCSQLCDHLNGNKLDNRKSNLKVCTQAENLRNIAKCNSISGYRGLRYTPKQAKHWNLYLKIGNKDLSLGLYANTAIPSLLFDCIQVWISNELECAVSSRVLNFPDIVEQTQANYYRWLTSVLTKKQMTRLTNAIASMVARSKCDKTSVYLAKRADGSIKIGVSRHPETRISGIRSGHNCKGYCPSTELIFSIELSTAEIAYSVEKQLHQYFANDRITGEWFAIDQSAAIAKLKELVNNSRFSQR
jgi:predicted GIY-YIG superfamily endonuclease